MSLHHQGLPNSGREDPQPQQQPPTSHLSNRQQTLAPASQTRTLTLSVGGYPTWQRERYPTNAAKAILSASSCPSASPTASVCSSGPQAPPPPSCHQPAQQLQPAPPSALVERQWHAPPPLQLWQCPQCSRPSLSTTPCGAASSTVKQSSLSTGFSTATGSSSASNSLSPLCTPAASQWQQPATAFLSHTGTCCSPVAFPACESSLPAEASHACQWRALGCSHGQRH